MAKTLDEALSQLFGTNFRTEGITTDPSDTTSVLTYDQLVEQIKAAYQNAKTSAQQGNWADYGRYLEQLEQCINQLDTADSATEQNDAAASSPDTAEAQSTASTEIM